MKEETKMLAVLFLLSSANDAIDDLTVSNKFVRELKKKTNNYLKFMKIHVHKEIDKTYQTDPDTFEEVQSVIDERAHNLSLEIINAFNRVIDEEA